MSVIVFVLQGMGPTRDGWRWRRPAKARAPRCAVQPLQASSVCGVVARQGRCVAEAGVRDTASRAARMNAEALVCPPAAFVARSAFSPGGPFVCAPTPGGAPGRQAGWRVSKSGAAPPARVSDLRTYVPHLAAGLRVSLGAALPSAAGR